MATEPVALDHGKVLYVVDVLQNIDMSPIDKRLIGKMGDKEYIDGLKGETIKFLGIAFSGEGNFAPSQKIDEYWHEMVLNTPFYASLSEKIGKFVHHIPSDKQEHEAYVRTLNAYKSVFGVPNKKYWKLEDAADCESFCDGGACEANCRD